MPNAPALYNGATGYQYDNRNQLTSEVSQRAGSYSNSYAYDLVGNPTTWKSVGQSFNSVNQNTQGGTLSFDHNGNPAGYQGTELNWDVNDNLYSFGNTLTAGYTSQGLRAWKQTAAGRTYYLYNGSTPICELDSNGNVTAVNTWGTTGLLSRYTPGGSVDGNVFYCFDPQGSVSVRLDSSGNILSSHTNEAWGTQISTVATNDPYAGYGGQWGYYKDAETGLHLLGERYYDTSSGRFLNRDPIGYAGGINLYGYGEGNPITGIDPMGTQADSYGLDAIVPGCLKGWVWGNLSRPPSMIFLGNWLTGNIGHDIHYGQNTVETLAMRYSKGADQMRAVLRKHGYQSTKHLNGVHSMPAFQNSISQPWNGTQFQVGAFDWKAYRKGNKMHMFIYNKVDWNSFAYHIPYYHNVFSPGIDLYKAWLNLELTGDATFYPELPWSTGWDTGCMHTVMQTFDWWEDVPQGY